MPLEDMDAPQPRAHPQHHTEQQWGLSPYRIVDTAARWVGLHESYAGIIIQDFIEVRSNLVAEQVLEHR